MKQGSNPQTVEESSRGAPPRPYGTQGPGLSRSHPWRAAPSDRTVPSSLPIYLREMGGIPLINQQREVRLARQLQESRVALAALALRLPPAIRDSLLEDDLDGPLKGREWPLERIERFCERLQRFADLGTRSRLTEIAVTAREHKRRLDGAREALTVANLRLVVHVAKRYAGSGVALLDLIQEGNLGLVRAVEKFHYELGNKFSTYAHYWIRQAIERSIVDKGRTIRIPVHLNEARKKVTLAAVQLNQRLGRPPRPKEIAKSLRLSVKKVEKILAIVTETQSLDDGLWDDRGRDLLQTLEDPNAVSPERQTARHELNAKIDQTLRTLNPREERIIRLRFGIGESGQHTLDDIGQMLALSRERVRQIEASILRKLQKCEGLADLLQQRPGAAQSFV